MRDAKEAVRNGDVFLIDPDVIAEDAIGLGYEIGGEVLEVLMELLEETSLNHYAGLRPPQRSYKKEIEGLDLFPFVVKSSRFKCRVYLKFAIGGKSFWLVSLHRDRPVEDSS